MLNSFRQERSKIAKAATSVGMDVDECIEAVTAEAETNGVRLPWTISVDWQMDRSIYEIRQGWWVRIDHAETLRALEDLALRTPGATGGVAILAATEVTGLDRDLTTLLAHVIRQQTLDDGSEPLGIVFHSRTLSSPPPAVPDSRFCGCVRPCSSWR